MADSKRLLYELKAKNHDLKEKLSASEKRLDALAKRTERANRRMQRAYKKTAGSMQFFKQVASVALGGVLARANLNAIGALTAELDRMAKTADGLGQSVEQLTALQGIAVEAGAAKEKFAKGFAKLNKVIVDADAGLTTYTRAFDRLGIKIHDQNGNLKSSTDIFFELKGAVDKYGASQEVIASIMDIFGARIGPQMVRVLNDMEGSMESVVARAKDLGVVIDERVVRNAENAQNQVDLMGQKLLAVKAEVLDPMIIAFGDMAEKIGNASVKFKEWWISAEGRAHRHNAFEGLKRVGQLAVSPFTSAETDARFDRQNRAADYKSALGPGLYRAFDPHLRGAAKTQYRPTASARSAGRTQSSALSDMVKADERRAKDYSMARYSSPRDKELYGDAQMVEKWKKAEAEKAKIAKQRADEIRQADEERHQRIVEQIRDREEREKQFYDSLKSNMASAFTDLITGTTSVKNAFNQMLNDIINRIIQQNVTNPLVDSIFGGGGGGLFGGLFGGGGGGSIIPQMSGVSLFGGPAPIPGFAKGGFVKPGQTAMTGEEGPELIRAGRSGATVTPMGKGASPVVINQTNHFASGLTKHEVGPLLEQNKRETLAAVVDGRRRGGSLRAAFGTG